jgi:hypothetical protein
MNIDKVTLDADSWADNLAVDNLVGLQIGPTVEFMIPVLGFGLDAAVLYSSNGFKLKGATIGALQSEPKTYKSNNLLIPVNLKYKIGIPKLIGAYATLGPYAKFSLDGDLKDQYESKTFGAGLNFGLGVEVLSHVQVGINYSLGLTEDYSKLQIPTASGLINLPSDLNAKPRTWTVSATYFF